MDWELIFAIIPGLILFLYGIDHFSKEIQQAAGDKFRSALLKLTKNRVRGATLGAFLTALIQSSTATTVIAVGLVNAGAISFVQSLGIIIGANVGTTITAQLIAFKLTAFAPFFILFGFLLSLIGSRIKFLGKPIFYFGLVFFALNLVSDALAPLRTSNIAEPYLAYLSSIPLAIFAGFAITVIFQSSSVTTGLVVLLADAGLLDLGAAIPLLLGANIGTTTTSLLASISMELYARRAALAHFLFNLIGALLLLPFLSIFISSVTSLGGNTAQMVANAHTLFNLGAALVFLIFLSPFRWVVEKIMPGTQEELLFKTKYLTETLPEKNRDCFEMIEKELRHQLGLIRRIFSESSAQLAHPTPKRQRMVEKLETISDYLDERIEHALLELSRRDLGQAEAERIVILVHLSNSFEQLADLGKDITELVEKLQSKGYTLSAEAVEGTKEVSETLDKITSIIKTGFPNLTAKEKTELRALHKKVRTQIDRHFKKHIDRLRTHKAYAGTIFVESISIMESSLDKLQDTSEFLESYQKLRK